MTEGEKEALKLKASYFNTIGAGLMIAALVTTPIAVRSLDMPHDAFYVAYAILASLCAAGVSLMSHQRAISYVRQIDEQPAAPKSGP